VTINEFNIPTGNSGPFGITTGPDGNLWFTETNSNPSHISQLNPTTHVIKEFPTPTNTSFPQSITAGPDGNFWLTEGSGHNIGEINPTTHAIAEFPLAAGTDPFGIAAGPDGNLWFTEADGNKIGEINPTTHAIAEFPIPTSDSSPLEIIAGPDGNLWFTEEFSNKIGEINPTTHAIAEFPVPTANGDPIGIAAGPDGNLWFTEVGPSKIGQINPTTHAIVEFPIPSTGGGGADPEGMSAGSDGNLWFAGQSDDFIAQAVLTDVKLSGGAPTSVALGSNVTYTLTVTNNGTAGATGVTLSDTLPSGVTFVSATGGVKPSEGVLTFGLGGLAAGDSTSVTIVITPKAAGNLSDIATTALDQTDPTPADNRITLPTTVTTPNTSNNSPDAPDLALSVDAPGSVAVGNTVNYTLTVTNGGTAGATGVTLTDTLPSGVLFVSATGGVQPVNGVLTFAIGNLAAGGTARFTIVVTPTAAGTLTDQARVGGDQNDPTPADNNVSPLTTVSPAGPAATSVHRFGFHAQPTRLVPTFDEPLDPARAQDPGNYRIVPLGGPPRRIRVKTAVYDVATRTVTLSPVHRLNLHRLFRLTVVGTGPSGVADASGYLLDGPSTGDPGGD
jgi:uncharacterized repeat protein (TIGR01451 family)